MAKNDIFVNFPFFRFPNQWKNAKMEYTYAQFLLFYILIFIQNQKKTEIEVYSIEFSIFPFLDQNRKPEKLKFVALDSYFSISSKKW